MILRKKAPAALALALLVALLAGCGGAQPAATGQSGAKSPTKVTIGSPQEPHTLMPHFDLLSAAYDVQRLAFDCPLAVDAKGAYLPQLAEVPTVENGGISKDGMTYTLKLRPGTAWADGSPLTAQDVKYTWQVVNNKSLPIPSREGWNAVQDVQTPADNVAVFKFATPNVVFLPTLATGNCFILPQHLLNGKDLTNSDFNRKPIGSGPYQVAEWVSGQYIRLTRNDKYWQNPKPAVDEIVFRTIPSTEGMRAAAERGEIDAAIQLSPNDREFYSKLAGWQVGESPDYGWWHFWLNTKDPALSDVQVRQALASGMDKAGIATGVFRGQVQPLWSVLPPNHWAYNPQVKTYPYDPNQAKALLDAAGWKVGANGIRQKDGKPLSLEILNISGQQERLQVIQIVQKNWRDLGIQVEIKNIAAASFPPTMSAGSYQVAYGSFGEQQEPVFNLWTSANWTGFTNSTATELIKQAMSSTDRDTRLKAIQQFQSVVAEQQPTIPLVQRFSYAGANSRLKGFAPSMSGNFWNAAGWQV